MHIFLCIDAQFSVQKNASVCLRSDDQDFGKESGFPLCSNKLRGTLEFLPHSRFRKDLIIYLNSSSAGISGDFKFEEKA